MNKGDYTQRKVITRTKRLTNSKYGNPRYEVHFDDATSARTETDGAVNYGLTNSENIGVPVDVTFNKSGRVIHVKPV